MLNIVVRTDLGYVGSQRACFGSRMNEGEIHMNNKSDCTGRLEDGTWDDVTDPCLDLSHFDTLPTGPMSFAVVCDGEVHPDRRVPYRVSVEAGVAVDEIEPIGMVS